ncbi:hypothetical protein JOQ06_002062 [Pogonophryne albipinna]|uniref:Uncharacterized protein n=1 Tax=Pogonophryne albipinna TaxID=1090488 RepID=A0AAD6A524_9TELE|nr:hypothetical protein JOQ06_002062 [Pogonophryne albipinna]
MQRFSDWMPSAMRGDQGGGGALSLAAREVEDNCFLFALSQDLRLRLWSFRDQACVLEADLLEYMPSCRGARSLPGHGHRLRLSLCSTGLCLGVYLAVPGRGQFTVLQLVSTDSNRYSLDHVSSLFTTQETLVDFTLTPTDIWAVWVDESNATVVKYINFEHNSAGQWNQVFVQPAPEDEVHIGVDQDPRETYLEVLFSPLRFTASAILKALQIFRRGSDRDRTSDVSWESLKKEVTVAVESELQSSVTEFEFSQEEYRQLQVEFWSKFYACCLQYQEALSLPLGLSISPGTGMALLLKKGFVSFLLPCFAVDHLYLSYDEYLSSEEETPIAEDPELGKDVLQLVQCLRLISDAVSVEMAYEMEKALEHLQSPERAADLVLESLLSNDSENVMEDIQNKLQDVRNPAAAMTVLLRELDLETDSESLISVSQDTQGSESVFDALCLAGSESVFDALLCDWQVLKVCLMPCSVTGSESVFDALCLAGSESVFDALLCDWQVLKVCLMLCDAQVLKVCLMPCSVTGQPLGVRISLSQLYGSSSAVSIVCQAVCHMTMTRVLFCRDLLILQKLYLRLGDNVFLGGGAQLLQLQQDLIPRSSNLLSSYHLLKHISQSMASSVALDIIEANLQHLTVLELSDSPSLSSASGNGGARRVVA